MTEFFSYIADRFKHFDPLRDTLDLILLTIVIYGLFAFLKKNNARIVSYVLAFFFITAAFIVAAGFTVMSLVVKVTAILFLMGIIVIFAMEIKRGLWKTSMGGRSVHSSHGELTEDEIRSSISEIVKACQNLAKNDVGAIIIIAQNNIPRHIIDSGVILSSAISSQLIESIFNTKAPLHDGAIIIDGNKIVAAGCFLPLSQDLNIPKELGTRHRAAIGISEAQHVLSIVVSEETGIISIAEDGKLKRYLDGSSLKEKLESVYELNS